MSNLTRWEPASEFMTLRDAMDHPLTMPSHGHSPPARGQQRVGIVQYLLDDSERLCDISLAYRNTAENIVVGVHISQSKHSPL